MIGRVFSIEEFATFDGPGIRTTVFIKGCPLSCTWCHNPEGQSSEVEFVRSPNGCIKCGKCESVAKILNGKIVLTEESVLACDRNLVRKCGIEYTDEELAVKLLKNAQILRINGGGVTFSGGEPLFNHEFLFSVIDRLKGKIHIAIQTSGFASSEVFDRAIKESDYFLYDLKLMDEAEHKKYCGVSNALIKKNYESLAKSGKPFITRIPLIPTVTDTEKNLRAIAEFMKANGVSEVEVLPYNKFAGSKYAMTLRSYEPKFDESKKVNDGREIFLDYGINYRKM